MASAHEKAYKNSPKLERGEDGKMKVGKKKADEKKGKAGDKGKKEDHEGSMPMHITHAMDRRDLHNRHEMEHMVHKGEKKKLHEKHIKEMQALHSKHEKEIAGHSEEGDNAAIENEAQAGKE